jgi:hypothetical protein
MDECFNAAKLVFSTDKKIIVMTCHSGCVDSAQALLQKLRAEVEMGIATVSFILKILSTKNSICR